MSTEWSAQGSHVLIGLIPTVVPIAEFRLVDMGRLAEATTSAGLKRKKVLSDGQGSFSMPWDSDLDPSTLGVVGGAEGYIGFFLGASGKWIPTLAMIIENVERIGNAVDDVLRLNISFFAQQTVPIPTNTA